MVREGRDPAADQCNGRIFDRADAPLYHSGFLLVAYEHIVTLCPIESLDTERPAGSPDAQEEIA